MFYYISCWRKKQLFSHLSQGSTLAAQHLSYRPDILLYLLLHILDTAANNAANPTMIDVNCGKQEIAILGTATKTAAYTGTPA
ncbi:MAG: hypothetical protein HFG84_06925 [Dorea sp.]|nr:hypothetical protein [Dorea sp.]